MHTKKYTTFIVKGSKPWYSDSWGDKSLVTNVDESISGQATVTCSNNVTNMYSMFYECTNLTSINLSNFDMSKVYDMSSMFDSCSSLTSIDLSNVDTSNVEDMSYMFYGCSNLTTIKGTIDMKSCTDYGSIFLGCTKLNAEDVNIINRPSNF